MQQKNENKNALWEKRRAQYKQSGLSRRAFCKKHNLKLSTLGYWLSRLGKQDKKRGLVELNHVSVASLVPGLILGIGQDCRIEIRRGFDAQLLEEVARALGGLR